MKARLLGSAADNKGAVWLAIREVEFVTSYIVCIFIQGEIFSPRKRKPAGRGGHPGQNSGRAGVLACFVIYNIPCTTGPRLLFSH